MNYEELLIEADNNGLITKEKPLCANKGRIKGNRIAIKCDLSQTEKACVLAEELGHYYTTSGEILDYNNAICRKQERQARLHAYDKMIGLLGIIDAYKNHCHNIYEIAEFLGVTEEFLTEALECYRQKYGLCTTVDNYTIFFEPIGILELFSNEA